MSKTRLDQRVTRLDQRVFDLGLAESREKAKAIIMSGAVYLNGQKADKPGMSVPADCLPEVRGETLKYVSRGGLKLEKALRVFPVDVSKKTCIDCGASTGGFTDVLLQNGAGRVYSVDVGYGQLAWKLRQDPRVVNLERCNLRYLTAEQVPEPLDIAVMDVSFISIRLIRDAAVHRSVIETCLNAAREAGYSVMGLDWSPIRGPEGNIEFLAWLVNAQREEPVLDISAVVEAAHGGKL